MYLETNTLLYSVENLLEQTTDECNKQTNPISEHTCTNISETSKMVTFTGYKWAFNQILSFSRKLWYYFDSNHYDFSLVYS